MASRKLLQQKRCSLPENISARLSSAAAPRLVTKVQRAARIEQSCRVSAYSFLPSRLTHGCACFVPEPGQNIHPPLLKKTPSEPRKWLGFLVNFWFWSALTLTLNQRVEVRVFGANLDDLGDEGRRLRRTVSTHVERGYLADWTQ